ncbi:Sucrose transport protein SUT4 [Platanthera guangdongensis]|uniref:Sucrose transport protein SUT4 n=1 Tax=Platanthera guangdongensis TaxID=2320717 RepID=A0ABR2MET7_9ASPA
MALTWLSWFPFFLFDNDWMGREVYHVNPKGNADEVAAYQTGSHPEASSTGSRLLGSGSGFLGSDLDGSEKTAAGATILGGGKASPTSPCAAGGSVSRVSTLLPTMEAGNVGAVQSSGVPILAAQLGLRRVGLLGGLAPIVRQAGSILHRLEWLLAMIMDEGQLDPSCRNVWLDKVLLPHQQIWKRTRRLYSSLRKAQVDLLREARKEHITYQLKSFSSFSTSQEARGEEDQPFPCLFRNQDVIDQVVIKSVDQCNDQGSTKRARHTCTANQNAEAKGKTDGKDGKKWTQVSSRGNDKDAPVEGEQAQQPIKEEHFQQLLKQDQPPVGKELTAAAVDQLTE